MRAEDILYFWFTEIEPSSWWRKSDVFDAMLTRRFGALLQQALAGELAPWRQTRRGRLAEIIVIDQFSRNIHRGSAGAFSGDAMALVLAQEAVALGVEANWCADWQQFLYMPYMHSESRQVHADAVTLFAKEGLESNYKFELAHKEIIDRFGRYPHRNAILGRKSTDEEIEFLKQPGSGF
ncbi:MAG: DUF924 domain-containing protein [Kordiimonadaceae bacterium]|nr:DUF924 domain-containing protein [Kordiimonadaceae bacterium]